MPPRRPVPRGVLPGAFLAKIAACCPQTRAEPALHLCWCLEISNLHRSNENLCSLPDTLRCCHSHQAPSKLFCSEACTLHKALSTRALTVFLMSAREPHNLEKKKTGAIWYWVWVFGPNDPWLMKQSPHHESSNLHNLAKVCHQKNTHTQRLPNDLEIPKLEKTQLHTTSQVGSFS